MALIKKKDELTIIVADNTEDMAVKAASDVARCILGLLQEKETINMIFAAAPSQSAFFNALVGHQEIPWNRINALHMDEYIGLEETADEWAKRIVKKVSETIPNRRSYATEVKENGFDSGKEAERLQHFYLDSLSKI